MYINGAKLPVYIIKIKTMKGLAKFTLLLALLGLIQSQCTGFNPEDLLQTGQVTYSRPSNTR